MSQQDTLNTAAAPAPITAKKVAGSDRLNFLPRFLGLPFMMAGESLVYIWMGRLCRDYNGGMWDFYDLSNGSGYMACATGERFCIESPNMESCEMSADAAGIVATTFALSDLIGRSQDDTLIDRYHQLVAFAYEHAEWDLIRRVID